MLVEHSALSTKGKRPHLAASTPLVARVPVYIASSSTWIFARIQIYWGAVHSVDVEILDVHQECECNSASAVDGLPMLHAEIPFPGARYASAG